MKVLITRKPDDPIALRASVGGDLDPGFYLVYRGEPKKVLQMLEQVTVAFKLEQEVRAQRKN